MTVIRLIRLGLDRIRLSLAFESSFVKAKVAIDIGFRQMWGTVVEDVKREIVR